MNNTLKAIAEFVKMTPNCTWDDLIRSRIISVHQISALRRAVNEALDLGLIEEHRKVIAEEETTVYRYKWPED